MKEKLFIFDVDGVLLDLWTPMKTVFEEFTGQALSEVEWDATIADYLYNPAPYMEFGKYFDNSDITRNLPPIDGMSDLIADLIIRGYDLAIITSISNKDEIKSKRLENLRKHFGDVFTKVICVERGGSKEQALKEVAAGYKFSCFCDDHPKNALLSKGIVSLPIWFANKHQKHIWDQVDNTGILYVENAEDINRFVP